jgi:energy-coupling factor transporter transmembrane protein EcfT
MAKNKFKTTFFGRAAMPIWLALATYGLTELFSRYPYTTELIYSQTFYPAVAFLLSFLSKHVSFSVDDAFYLLLAVFLLVLLILVFLKKMKFGRFILTIIQTLALIYILFYWFWGFNYFRSRINDRLQISKSKPDTVQFVEVLENLISQTNDSYCNFENIRHSTVDSLVEDSYKKNASFLKIHYPQGIRRPKPITLSNFFAKASIAGYYGPFFSEVQVNDSLLNIEYPQVLAHEMAHQFGITSEAEANFYSWLVCTQSDSKQLQYSANISMLNYFLSQGKQLHNFADLVHQISKPVIDDIRQVQQHWEKMRSEKIDQVAGKVNDAYLKTNKIEKGIEDYFGVVQFVMDFETDSMAQKRVDRLSNQ